jgi:hypothetical protein
MNQLMVNTQEQDTSLATLPQDDLTIARNALASGLLPESITTPQQAVLIIAKGREIGIKPMASFKHLYIIKNQVGMDSALITYLYTRRGHSLMPVERSAEKCSIRFTNRNGASYTHTLTLDEVAKAGWNQYTDKKTDRVVVKAQWLKMPEVMLYYRTLTTGIRMVDPGCLLGAMSDDELMDVDPIEDQEIGTVEGQVTDIDLDEEPTGSELTIQQPTPNAGFTTWPEPKKRMFWAKMSKAALKEDAVHIEFGVASMNNWAYSTDQTRLALEVLEFSPDITLDEKKRMLGIGKLADIVLFGWTAEDCKATITDAIEAAK